MNTTTTQHSAQSADADEAATVRKWTSPFINYYGCVKCQANHFEGDPAYQPHIGFQSKNSIQQMLRADYESVRERRAHDAETADWWKNYRDDAARRKAEWEARVDALFNKSLVTE